MNQTDISKGKGIVALSPIFIFLLVYIGVSLIEGDFYKMPISVAFIIGTIWAIIFSKGSFSERINTFSKGAANSNILFMLWIFILAGAFASIAKEIGAIDATVNLTLKYLPEGLIVPGMFIASCLISMAIGTSVGTVTALVPLAIEMAVGSDGSVAYYVAAVLSGSFFGDNLSFISDTTIASTRTQNCKMNDKFKTNIWISIPAAIIVLAIYLTIGISTSSNIDIAQDINGWLILPYILVIGIAINGVNVILVLSIGILSSIIIGLVSGNSFIQLCGAMGTGIEGMGTLIIVTLLAAGLLALIDHNGGIKFIIKIMTNKISNSKIAYFTIGGLVAFVNLCTANNTIAIITVGELSKTISDKFHLDNKKVASILDTSSCIVQCVIPYGAQMLLATSLANVSPVSLFPYLYYPLALTLMVVLSILFNYPKSRN